MSKMGKNVLKIPGAVAADPDEDEPGPAETAKAHKSEVSVQAYRTFLNSFLFFFFASWKLSDPHRRIEGAVSSFTHILFSYFLAILRIFYRFSLIKAHKLHYFYLLLYSRDNGCAAKSLQFQRLHPASIFAFSML